MEESGASATNEGDARGDGVGAREEDKEEEEGCTRENSSIAFFAATDSCLPPPL